MRGWLLEGHARAVGREHKKEKDLDVAQAEVRQLKDERFGKRTEKQPPTDRSHDLIDPNKPTQPKSPIKTRFPVSSFDQRLPNPLQIVLQSHLSLFTLPAHCCDPQGLELAVKPLLAIFLLHLLMLCLSNHVIAEGRVPTFSIDITQPLRDAPSEIQHCLKTTSQIKWEANQERWVQENPEMVQRYREAAKKYDERRRAFKLRQQRQRNARLLMI